MNYEIKNWSKFQQYKDGRPMQWIKVHVGLLDNYQFDELEEIDQLNLIKLWLFAAKTDGKFEGSEKFIARKIGARKFNINNLLLNGFIVRTDSYENVPREEEKREEESRGEEKRIVASDDDDNARKYTFDNFYSAYPIKKSKQQAIKSWKNLSNDDQILAVEKTQQFISGIASGINPPHPSTYLNNKRWEDEAAPMKLVDDVGEQNRKNMAVAKQMILDRSAGNA